MPQNNEQIKRRIRESWRMQAVSAGLCTGAQVYLLGAGIAVPLCGNSAWIASLAAVPAAALLAAIAGKRLAGGGASRAGLCALALACFLLSVFSCAALVLMAEQSLLPQAQAVRTAALTAAFVSLCASSGRGEVRLCFLIRRALPVILIGAACLSLPRSGLHGLFPILGRSAGSLAAAAAAMTAAAVPALTIILPPQELKSLSAPDMHVPETGFFARRAAAGALAGCAAVFLLCAGNTPEILAKERLFGMRLLAPAGGGAHQGIFDTAVILALTAACALTAARLLACAASAAQCAFAHALKGHRALIVLGAALAAALLVFAALGETAVPGVGLTAVLPGLCAAASGGKKRGNAS